MNRVYIKGRISNSKSFFVRPTGTTYGTGDGTSYANAWSGFPAIDWGILENQKLFICGTHLQGLTVDTSNIRIFGNNSFESGTIDGEDTRATNITVNSYQNVYFEGLTSLRATQNGIFIRGTAIVTTKDCVFSEIGNQGIQHHDTAIGYHYNLLCEDNFDDGISAHHNSQFYVFGGNLNNNKEGINIINDTRGYVYGTSFSGNIDQDVRVISEDITTQCILEISDCTIDIIDVSTNAKLIATDCIINNLKIGAGTVRSYVEMTNCEIGIVTNNNLVDETFRNCKIQNLIKPNTSLTNVIRLYDSYCRIQQTFNYTGILIARRTLFSGLSSTQITLDMVSGSTTDIANCIMVETASTRFAMTFRTGANIIRFDNVTIDNNGIGNGVFSLVAHTFNNIIIYRCVTGMQASSVTLVANNCCFNSNTTNTVSTVTQVSSQTGAPNFVDSSTKDYRLDTGSSCISTGITAVEDEGIFTADWNANLPDVVSKTQVGSWNIGAYVN